VASSLKSDGDTLLPWQILDQRLLVDRSPYAKVFDEDVQLPGGAQIKNFVRVELPAYVMVFALLKDERVTFVRQYRLGARDYLLELPAGHLEDAEDALPGAQRELLEETGVAGSDWQSLGKYMMDANRQCGWAYLYLVRDVEQVALPDAGDLGDVSVEFFSLDAVHRAWAAGEFISAPTALCIGLALDALRYRP
jgi:8-oxo-dGTP pyrophosphatase MutT (NUDIX family)